VAVPIYIVKRKLKAKRKNGQPRYRYSLRWRDPQTGQPKCETAGTADLTQAKAIRDQIYAEVNRLVQPPPEPEAEIIKPTWQDCRDALKRAMEADNLRTSTVADAMMMLKSVQTMFPAASSPADITPDMANEYKRLRSERGLSPWTIDGDLSTLRAIFGKWLAKECGLLSGNPFANVKPPKCDEPDVRIVTADETADLFAWLDQRWNNWRLPVLYLEVAALLGWRATEIASLRDEDLVADGFVRVSAEACKTRTQKWGWLPADLHEDLRACSAGGWAFGRFADELRRLLLVWRHQPHHAAKIKEFSPERFVGWLQDELQRYNIQRAEQAAEAVPPVEWHPFTLHDFRKTAITGMQMAGTSEKEASIMVGCTPEVMRRHYEKLDRQAIARRNVERRLGAEGTGTLRLKKPKSVGALLAREESKKLG
jgi:integrase